MSFKPRLENLESELQTAGAEWREPCHNASVEGTAG